MKTLIMQCNRKKAAEMKKAVKAIEEFREGVKKKDERFKQYDQGQVLLYRDEMRLIFNYNWLNEYFFQVTVWMDQEETKRAEILKPVLLDFAHFSKLVKQGDKFELYVNDEPNYLTLNNGNVETMLLSFHPSNGYIDSFIKDDRDYREYRQSAFYRFSSDDSEKICKHSGIYATDYLHSRLDKVLYLLHEQQFVSSDSRAILFLNVSPQYGKHNESDNEDVSFEAFFLRSLAKAFDKYSFLDFQMKFDSKDRAHLHLTLFSTYGVDYTVIHKNVIDFDYPQVRSMLEKSNKDTNSNIILDNKKTFINQLESSCKAFDYGHDGKKPFQLNINGDTKIKLRNWDDNNVIHEFSYPISGKDYQGLIDSKLILKGLKSIPSDSIELHYCSNDPTKPLRVESETGKMLFMPMCDKTQEC